MRAAADDVNARHLAVIVVVIVMITFDVITAISVNVAPDITMENNTVAYHLRVIYICDKSAIDYCQINATTAEMERHFSENNEDIVPDCYDTNTNCNHSRDTSNNSSTSSTTTFYVEDNKVIIIRPVSNTVSLLINVSYHNMVEGNIRDRISGVDALVTSNNADVIVVIGDTVTVQTTAIVAEGLDVPVIGYITEYNGGAKNIQGATFVGLNPSPEAQGRALTQIIGRFNMKQTTIIVDDTKLADGFLHGVRQAISVRHQDIFYVVPLSINIGNNALLQKLTDLSSTGWKVIVVHCSPQLMLKVVNSALSTRLYNTGHAWFLSEMAFSRDPDMARKLPVGLLAIDNFWLGGIPEVMVEALEYVMSSVTCVLDNSDGCSYSKVPYEMDGNNVNDASRLQKSNMQVGVAHQVVTVHSLRNTADFVHDFLKCLRNLVHGCDNSTLENNNNEDGDNAYSMEDETDTYIKSSNSDGFSGVAVQNFGPAFYLLNTIEDGTGGHVWAKVGYITASGRRDLKTVLWPGHNIYGPSSSTVKTYRVVTRPAEPFVFISNRVDRKEDCFIDVPCLKVANSSNALLSVVVDDFQTDMQYLDDLYTVHCCKGLSLEMLDRLAIDLNFRYVVYFVNDTDYGTLDEGNWTGMVGDVISGAADIIAGAFSMTSERMKVIGFTEPFYQNEFSVVTGGDGSYVSIWAFFSPFSGQVWLCIMLSSVVAGVATSFLEWRSPFGLNPRGRKRTKNYGLGSGILMVVALLTGHTINVKAPKSWPGKVIQNVWAGLAIFIMTSYTANLAAYLAGQSAVTDVKNVYDSDLLTKRVAVVPSSAVESFVEKINPQLSQKAKMNYVDSTLNAINMLRNRTIDIYLDDTPLLEYGLARYDQDCKIKFVRFQRKGFGSDGYAFGLSRHSWLKIPMSNQILWYTDSGYMQELAKKYLSRPLCEHFLAGAAIPYGLEHTGGLFIILSSAIILCVFFLILEHLAYHYFVPWLRKQPPESFWKTENFAFISQRVSRVVRSEKLYSQKQAAQEMIKIVKQRDFTRLIQKNELQKRRTTQQKRIKTKAEVFQEITANIVSYHRQLQSASETAENSDADIDQEELEGVDNDAINDLHDIAMGVNNAAYSSDNPDLALDIFFRRRGTSSSVEDYDDDENDDIVFPPEIVLEDQFAGRGASPVRKLSSRSMYLPSEKPHGPLVRKHSDSYFLYPSYQRPEHGFYVLPNYDHAGNGSKRLSFLSSLTRTDDADDDHSQPGHERIFRNADENDSVNPSNMENSNTSMNVNPSQAELSSQCVSPPPSHGSSYYHSPTSSSIQSPSDEKREFSPLPSPASATTDDFTGCDESLGSISTLPPDSSTSLTSPANTSIDNDSQGLESQGNASQASAETYLSTPRPTRNPVVLDVTNHDILPHQLPKAGHPKKGSVKSRHPTTDGFPRSASTNSFPRQIRQNNDMSTSANRIDSEPNHDLDFSVVSISEDGHNGETPLSENSKNNGVYTIEGTSAKRVIRALRKSSDVNPVRVSGQQQNNTRRTRSYDKTSRDYFKRNLRLKDNRVKSTLRRHAMSGYQSQLPANFIDECTLEALSKEDILILWKKSEIDLEGRLQEVLARNRRLSLAIDYLTKDDRPAEPEEV